MGQYFAIEYANLWMGIKETALRTSAEGKDTTNAVGASFRRFPIRWDGGIQPKRLIHRVIRRRSAGKGLDYSHVYREGYEPCKMTISGEIVDFAFLYQLCGNCATAGTFTHTYITSTAIATVWPSFQMLQKIGNAVTGETEYLLYTGCKIKSLTATWREGGKLMGSLEIECANVIAGTALTTEPNFIDDAPYYFDPTTAFSLKKDGVAYAGTISEWSLYWNNGQYLRVPDFKVLPDRILGDFRTVELSFKWIPEDKDNIQLDPATETDIDVEHVITNGVDTLEMDWAKVTLEYLGEAYNYKNFYLGRDYRISLNPRLVSTLTMLETNSANATYYEGA